MTEVMPRPTPAYRRLPTLSLRPRGAKSRSRRKPAPPRSAGVAGAGVPEERSQNSIVPPRSVARRALLALVAIMSFLACLSVAAVSVVADRAEGWQRQISEEVTIQIKPSDDLDMSAALARAVDVATQMPGVVSAQALSDDEASALLEPWLGSDFDASELPIPQIVAVRVNSDIDLAALGNRIREEVPGASLDDHGQWLQRLASMANVTTFLGLFVLGLVFAATALCVVFATRGAMAGNRTVIEVLHFVGAEDSYVASQFQRHFLLLGLRGAGLGGITAAGLFALVGFFGSLEGPTPEEAQLRSVFGGLSVGPVGYIGCIATVLALALIIAITARLTVRRTLAELD